MYLHNRTLTTLTTANDSIMPYERFCQTWDTYAPWVYRACYATWREVADSQHQCQCRGCQCIHVGVVNSALGDVSVLTCAEIIRCC